MSDIAVIKVVVPSSITSVRLSTGLVGAAEAAASAQSAANSASAAAADRSQTNLDRIATTADAVSTAADRVQTGLDRAQTTDDRAATAADRVQTGLDRAAVSADKTTVAGHATSTAADRVQTGLDAVATAADRVQTGLDRVQTGADVIATAADRVQTGLDKTATAADRIQTGVDASTSADNAAAAYEATLTATAQAGLAQSYAASASSVAQQDLSGVQLATLHRSPNAVVAAILYDTSRDSDGGAWVEKCADKSWARETLMGTWLGQFASEMDARDYFGALGAQSVITGDSSTFTNGVGDWTAQINATVTRGDAGTLRVTASGIGPIVKLPALATVVGQRYRVQVRRVAFPATKNCFLYAGTSAGNSQLMNKMMDANDKETVFYASFVATTTTTHLSIGGSSVFAAGDVMEFDDYTVTPVDLSKDPSGAYFQNSVAGTFYRLWRNIAKYSEFPSGTANLDTAGSLVSSSTLSGFDGAIFVGADGINNQNALQTVGTQFSGMTVTISAVVEMTDGLAPAFGNAGPTNVANDFAFVMGGSASSPVTHTVTALGGNRYRVTGSRAAGATSSFGVLKYGTNSARTFKFTALSITLDASASYEKKTVGDMGQGETFRGNKAKFPRLAGIVAEAQRVVIYDLLEPGRPMWRYFTPSSRTEDFGDWWRAARDVSGLAAREGRLVIALGAGTSLTTRGLPIVDFAGDKLVKYATSGDYSGVIDGVVNYARRLPAPGSFPALAHTSVNAVAMTVLPDAPVDPVTGLQAPTIAIGTGVGGVGGICVIRHDGTVTNPIVWAAFNVGFDTKGNVVTIGENSRNYRKVLAPLYTTFTTSQPFNNNNYVMGSASKGRQFGVLGAATLQFPGYDRGLVLHRPNDIDTNAGLFATLSNEHNTGWMVGDIRRAWVADTITGTLNGNDVWNDANAAFTGASSRVSPGVYRIYTPDGSFSSVHISGFKPGRAYELTFNIDSITTLGNGVKAYGGITEVSFQTTGPKRAIFVVGPAGAIGVARNTTACDFQISGLTAREVSYDRGPKGDRPASLTALVGNGVLSRTPVAAAAQLVAVSGFSASNYLQEAYSADLDPGTGPLRAAALATLPTGATTDNMGAWVDAMPVGGVITHTSVNLVPGSGTAVDNGDGTWTVTSGGMVRFNFDLANLKNGFAYEVAANVTAATGGYALDFCDGFVKNYTGTGVKAHRAGRASGYNSTYRFVDVLAAAGQTVTVQAATLKEVANPVLFDRSGPAGAYYRVSANAWGALVAEISDGTTTRTVTTPAAYNTGQPFSVAMEYSAGKLAMVVNGREVASTTGTPLLTLNNASAVATVGNRRTLDAAWPGSIAMVKAGMTVPTADANAWIYEQEKQMWAEGAQVTLSDAGAIVDIDYDRDTDQILVASAANESTFNGLVRTSSAGVKAGSINKVFASGGAKLIARTGTLPGVDVTLPPMNLKEQLVRRAEDIARQGIVTRTFDYDATTSQTDFALPVGWETVTVMAAGSLKREGSTKDWQRKFDGFKETVSFNTGQSSGTWVQITARRAA